MEHMHEQIVKKKLDVLFDILEILLDFWINQK